MAHSVKDMVASAKAEIPDIAPADARALADRDDVLMVDVRDDNEVAQTGKVRGAIHVTRGMLEFRADPQSPFHDEAFSPDKTVLVYCASGGRAALAGQALKRLGYTDVRNLGGFKDWVEGGGGIEP